jgi:hypothetical protein
MNTHDVGSMMTLERQIVTVIDLIENEGVPILYSEWKHSTFVVVVDAYY